jgi:hypothetical protein
MRRPREWKLHPGRHLNSCRSGSAPGEAIVNEPSTPTNQSWLMLAVVSASWVYPTVAAARSPAFPAPVRVRADAGA